MPGAMLHNVACYITDAPFDMQDVTTGDTLCDEKQPIILERMEFPDPVIKVRNPGSVQGPVQPPTSLASFVEASGPAMPLLLILVRAQPSGCTTVRACTMRSSTALSCKDTVKSSQSSEAVQSTVKAGLKSQLKCISVSNKDLMSAISSRIDQYLTSFYCVNSSAMRSATRLQVAIEPKTKADLDKMGNGLYKLAQEDPSFHFQRDDETNQTVIEVSMEVVTRRIRPLRERKQRPAVMLV